MPGYSEIPPRPSARHRYVQRRAGRVWYLPRLSRNPAPGKSLDTQPGEIAYHKEVEIFDDKKPFVDLSCMPDRQGFSDKDIEALRKPNNRQASRTSPRTPAESALPASVHAANDAAPAPVPDMQASAAGDGDADLIQEASDKAMATFSSKRKLLLDLGKDAFYEHAWKVK
jgi:hypothetical protein